MDQKAPRRRDPNRKRAILDAAARLVADRSYAAVTMADIGDEVGIAASAIYWHYKGKQQLLVALFDDCLDRLLREQHAAVERLGSTKQGVIELTGQQVDFVVGERSFAKVYYHEAPSLPAAELARLRRKQRRYVDVWTHLLGEVRPDLAQREVEDLVHAAIGSIQSALVHRSRLDRGTSRDVLLAAALRVQGVS